MSGVSGDVRLRFARYVGLIGAVLLGAAAYVGGALPDSDLSSDLPRIWAQPNGPLSLSAWLVGTGLMVAAWLIAGTALPARVGPRWLVVTAVLWAAPLLLAPPLGSRDVYAYACQGAVYAAGLDPYAAGPASLPCPWLHSISLIWRETPAPYGPLFVALTAAAVRLAGGHLWIVIGMLRLFAVLGVGLAAWYLPRLVRATRGGGGSAGGGRAGAESSSADARRAVWLGLASPLVGAHLISGAHNDALMIGLGVAGLYYAARCRPLLAGGWLGLAIAVKATAGVALPFAILLVVRAAANRVAADAVVEVQPADGGAGRGDGAAGRSPSPSRLAVATGWTVLGCAAAYGAVVLATGLGFGWVRGLRHSGDSVQWTSVPTGVGIAVGYVGRLFGASHLTSTGVSVARTVGLCFLVVVGVALWWRVRRRDLPGILRHAGWALVGATALAPVFHPWYWLWPLTVLAAAGVPGVPAQGGVPEAVPGGGTGGVRAGSAGGATARWLIGLTAALAFLVLPDGYNLARATRLPGALAVATLVVAGLVWLARVAPRRASDVGI